VIAAGVVVVALFLKSVGGKVEGRLFPVLGRSDLAFEVSPGSGWSRIGGTAARLRDCDFVRAEWRHGTREAYRVVDLVFEEGGAMQSNGHAEFGPWLVHLRPAQLRDQSSAVVYHRCHPLWLTESLLFDSQDRR
jgi:hypothetical protein